MRKQFPLFYHLSEDEKRELFKSKDCFFVFDTNALLDIYRLGKETAEKVLFLLNKFKDRIIIPKHVACEYHNHMLDIITEIHAYYDDFLTHNDKKSVLTSISSTLKIDNTPSIKRKMVKFLEPAIIEMLEDIKREREYILNQFKTWDLQRKLSDALGSLVLEGFSEERIKEIEKEGVDRYSKKIPPGYMDEKEKDTNVYGDLIIWEEVLDFAKKKQCSIIFIGRDMKEDWLQRLHGMTCGPRQELIDEFSSYSPKGCFYIYTLDQFLEFANEIDKVLNDNELSEVKDLVTPAVVEKDEGSKTKSSTPVKTSYQGPEKIDNASMPKIITNPIKEGQKSL